MRAVELEHAVHASVIINARSGCNPHHNVIHGVICAGQRPLKWLLWLPAAAWMNTAVQLCDVR
jgi:hypothetical protein